MTNHIIDIIIYIAWTLWIGHILWTKTKLNPMLFYILGGLVLWPVWFGVVKGEDISIFWEIGLIFLMFFIWTHLNLETFIKMKKEIFVLWLLQILFSGILIWGFLVWFDSIYSSGWHTSFTTIILWLWLALSSSAIVLEKLVEYNLMDSPIGKAKTWVLIFQDLLVPLFIIFIPLLTSAWQDGTIDLYYLLFQIGKTILYIILTGVSIIYIIKPLLNRLLPIILKSESRWFTKLFWIIIAIGGSFIAEKFWMSTGIGALIAGLAIAETKYKDMAVWETEWLKELFMAMFFLYIGALINIDIVLQYWYVILFLTIWIKVSKVLGSYLATRLQGYNKLDSLMIGINISQVSEFTLVISWMLLSLNLMNNTDYQIINSSIILTMILSMLILDKSHKFLLKKREIKLITKPEHQEMLQAINKHSGKQGK